MKVKINILRALMEPGMIEGNLEEVSIVGFRPEVLMTTGGKEEWELGYRLKVGMKIPLKVRDGKEMPLVMWVEIVSISIRVLSVGPIAGSIGDFEFVSSSTEVPQITVKEF